LLILPRVSLLRPAPAESPRLGTEQGYAVERCDKSSLPFFYCFPSHTHQINYHFHSGKRTVPSKKGPF